jgi:hypothetical protein
MINKSNIGGGSTGVQKLCCLSIGVKALIGWWQAVLLLDE